MPRDEFNSVNIINDRQISGNEFGNFSRTEYTFTSENKINSSELNASNKDELNDLSHVNNNDNDDIDKQLTQREREMIENASNGDGGSSAASSGGSSGSSGASSSSSSSSSSSASAGGGASGSVSAGGAASAAGAATASGAVAASAVVVTAFAVVAAAPIILSNAHINEETAIIEPGENEVYYELELLETFEDENYTVTVTNDTYDQSQPLVEGLNSGTFEDLTVNRDYELMVIEGTESEISRILYRQSFRTYQEEEPEPQGTSEVRGATLSTSADFINNTFDVTLDYVDDFDKFSNFAVTLTRANQVQPQGLLIGADSTTGDGAGNSKTFALAKTTETQTIEAGSDFYLASGSFTYSFSYESTDNPGQSISIATSTSVVTFVDEVHKSVVNSATLLEEADFRNVIVTVNLDFVDDYNKLSDFKLILQEVSPEPDWQPEEMVYALQKVNGNQTVELNDEEHETALDDRSFNYMITYRTTDSSEEQIANSGQITFTDPTYISQFYGATIDSQVNMTDKEFTVELNFQDDYGVFYDIQLLLYYMDDKQGNLEYTFRLDDVTDPQTVSFSEMQEREYNYKFTYRRYDEDQNDPPHVISSGTVTFDDPNWVPSTAQFYGVNFISADYNSRTVTAQLDYLDPDGFLGDDMELILFDHSKGVTKKFSTTDGSLEKTPEPQELSLDVQDETFEGGIDVSSTGGFDYSFTYTDNNEEKHLYGNDLTVEDVDGNINGVDFKFNTKKSTDSVAYANSRDETFVIYYNYNNFFANLEWSGFQLEISDTSFDVIDEGGNGTSPTQSDWTVGKYSLSTNGWRSVKYFDDDPSGGINLLNPNIDYFFYRITYFKTVDDSMTGDEARSTLIQGPISFTDELTPDVAGVNVGNLVEISSDECFFPIQFLFDNPNTEFNDINVQVKTEMGPEISIDAAAYSGMFEKDMDWQVARISTGGLEDLGIDESNPSAEVIVEVYSSGDATSGNGQLVFTDTVTLTLEQEDDPIVVYGMRYENMLFTNQNSQYYIQVDHLIFTGLFPTDEGTSPRYIFIIESGEGDWVNQEMTTVLDAIPTHMDQSPDIILGNLDDSYFDINNEIVISVYIEWFDDQNNRYRETLCEHHTFYKQA